MHYTSHARLRCKQRGLRPQDVEYVLLYGAVREAPDGWRVYLRYRDIPYEERKQYARLDGVTVILSRDMQQIITVYRSARKTHRPYRNLPLGV